MRRQSNDPQNDGEFYPEDEYHSDAAPQRPSLLSRLLRRRPRIFQLNASADDTKQSGMTITELTLRFLPAWILLLIILLIAPSLPLRAASGAYRLVQGLVARTALQAESEPISVPLPVLPPPMSPVFTEEVDFWSEQIGTWALTYEIEPNLIATVMQIESCGDSSVSSPAGASGLFQVMGLHFEPDEEHFEPDTNARAGLSFLAFLMELAEGDVAGALAGYNAGERAIDTPHELLPNETQRYVYWGTGIYEEAEAGVQSSQRLNEWLEAGGTFLCDRAAERLGLVVPAAEFQP